MSRSLRTHLLCIEDLDHARVSKGAQFPERVASEGQSRLVRGYVEGEDATFGTVFLEPQSAR